MSRRLASAIIIDELAAIVLAFASFALTAGLQG